MTGNKKPAKIIKSWNGNAWEIEARSGKKGAGQVLAQAEYWDNDRAEEQAWDGVFAKLDRLGYEVTVAA